MKTSKNWKFLFKFKLLNGGDVYKINIKSKEKLESIIKQIAEGFGIEHDFLKNEIIETIKRGEDYRFDGTFNLRLLKNNILCLDNRNGRGVKENKDILKKFINNLT